MLIVDRQKISPLWSFSKKVFRRFIVLATLTVTVISRCQMINDAMNDT